MIRRITLLCVFALGVLGVGACDKPTQPYCEKALRNIQRLLGTENILTPSQLQNEVRRCSAASSNKAVECAIAAQSLDDINRCDFEKNGKHHFATGSAAGSGSAIGSSIGSAGSAAVPAGSDTIDSPTPPPPPSGAAGSAAAGSAAK
ncbi:hypothetical protein BH11MYX1_BH11MYX1_20800 [soil metagenome]